MNHRLHIVSGKGGVGKTLVAAGLAAGYAQSGVKTLLVSFDRTGIPHPVYGVVPEYGPVSVEPDLWLSRVDAHQALREYVRRKVTLPLLYEPLIAQPPVQKLLDALPIFDELMCLGKLYDLVTDRASPFAQVVFDAPSTGHCCMLLNVPQVAVDTLIGGPVLENAKKIRAMLQDASLTELRLVTLPEETPVRETSEFFLEARERFGICCEEIVINRTLDASLSDRDSAELAEAAAAEPVLQPLRVAVALQRDLVAEQSGQIQRLAALGCRLRCLGDHSHLSSSERLAATVSALRGPLDGAGNG